MPDMKDRVAQVTMVIDVADLHRHIYNKTSGDPKRAIDLLLATAAMIHARSRVGGPCVESFLESCRDAHDKAKELNEAFNIRHPAPNKPSGGVF